MIRMTNCNAERAAIMKMFRTPSVPPTTSKSIRFPNDLIEQIEEAIRGTDCTFSAFVVEAVRVALADLEEESNDEKRKE